MKEWQADVLIFLAFFIIPAFGCWVDSVIK